MKWYAYLLTAAVTMAAPATKTYTGTIYENRCVGPNCATQCPVKKGLVYTLQTEDRAWVLNSDKTPARFVGKKVSVTATAVSDNKLNVISIAPGK
jgi:hypothetical protein